MREHLSEEKKRRTEIGGVEGQLTLRMFGKSHMKTYFKIIDTYIYMCIYIFMFMCVHIFHIKVFNL